MPYDEFIITIRGRAKTGYTLDVERRLHSGIVRKMIQQPQPFDAASLCRLLPTLQKNLTRAIQGVSYDAECFRRFGARLYRELFTGRIKEGWHETLSAPRETGNKQRIRFQLPPDLQMLPWELLYGSDGNVEGFLCLNGAFTIVRSNPDTGTIGNVPITLPLHILVVVSTPLDDTPLDARKEIDQLLDSVSKLIRSGKVQVDFVHGADTLGNMTLRMKNQPYHILHFIGHGKENGLVLEDERRKALDITAERLYSELVTFSVPRLVFLNVCKGASPQEGTPSFTNLAESFLRAGIPAVLAHQFEISDPASKILAWFLYKELANGSPVDAALATARRRVDLRLSPSLEWHTPVLFLHNDSGNLFTVAAVLDQSQLAPDAGHLVTCANLASEAGRWSEAANYIKEAQLINPDHEQVRTRLDQMIAEERLIDFLHEAQFAEQWHEWGEAARQYEQYLDDALVKKDPARYDCKRIRQLKHLAQGGTGFPDPWLRWKIEQTFPYQLLQEHDIDPGSSAKEVLDIYPFEPEETDAKRTLRDLPTRLGLDFFLYEVHDERRLADFMIQCHQMPYPPSLRDLRKGLGEDAPVVLLRMGERDEARRLLMSYQQMHPADARAAHRLALLTYADAQQYEENNEAEQATAAWQTAIGNWILALTDDAYWKTWCRRRQFFYGNRGIDQLDQAQRDKVRENLVQHLADELARYADHYRRETHPRAEVLHNLAIRYEAEWRGAQALKAASGLDVKGVPLACGPLLLRQLDLHDPFSKWVADRQRSLDAYQEMDVIEALKLEKAPDVSSEILQQVRLYFSELAPVAALLALHQPQTACAQLPNQRARLAHAEFATCNPAYSRLPGNIQQFNRDLAELAIRIHNDVARLHITAPQPNLRAAARAWRTVLQWGQDNALEQHAVAAICELALGRVRALRNKPERDTLAYHNETVALLETAYNLVQHADDGKIVYALSKALLARCNYWYWGQDDHFKALDDSKRAFDLNSDNLDFRIDFCIVLIECARDRERAGNKEEALRLFEQARNVAQQGLDDHPDNKDLLGELQYISDKMDRMEGKDPGERAFADLMQALAAGNQHPRSVESVSVVQESIAEAREQRRKRNYPKAVTTLNGILEENPSNSRVKAELAATYGAWAQYLLENAAVEAAEEKLKQALQHCPDDPSLHALQAQIKQTRYLLGA